MTTVDADNENTPTKIVAELREANVDGGLIQRLLSSILWHGEEELNFAERDAALLLGISERTLRDQRQAGTAPAHERHGRRVLYPRWALREYKRARVYRSNAEYREHQRSLKSESHGHAS